MIWCSPKKCMRRDAWAGVLSWWSCQSPVAHSCSLLNHPNSFCGGMFKLNTKYDAGSLLCSLSHLECDGHTVHMLSQWHLLPSLTTTVKLSCSHTYSPVHGPWPPGSIDVVQTVLIILTIAGLFPHRSQPPLSKANISFPVAFFSESPHLWQ